MKEAVIVSAVRTAVGRAKRGTLVDVRPDEMASVVIKEVLNRAEWLTGCPQIQVQWRILP